MKTITLSGWGQPHDTLGIIAPNATHIDYAKYDKVEDALADIASHQADIVIGWSLGGQLAARALVAGLFAPKKLVLIATPFQFVATPENSTGMGRDTYNKFRDNYARNPERTLHKAWELIHKHDAQAHKVYSHLEKHDKPSVLEKNWLFWLDALDGYSLHDKNLKILPPTLLIHGDQDAVVAHAQSELFKQAVTHAKLISLQGAGHAPHWHDTAGVKRHIGDFIHD